MSQPLIEGSIEDELAKADEKLKEAGIDPEAEAAPEDGEPGDLSATPEVEEETPSATPEPEETPPAAPEGGDTPKPTATEPGGEKITFDTREELATFIQEQLKTLEDKKSTPEEKKDAKDAIDSIEFFPKDWKPTDWNQAAHELMKVLRPAFKQADKLEIDEANKKMQDLNKTWDETYTSLAKEKKVPEINTEEGKAVNKELAAICVTYGVFDYGKAYDIWSKLPTGTELTFNTETGETKTMKVGGLKTVTTPPPKPNPSRAAARFVNTAATPEAAKTKVKDYQSVHNRSLDDQMPEDL